MKAINNILAYRRLDNGILASFNYTSKLSIINANQVEEELLQLIKNGENSVFLDFSNIEFIDTAGFHALLSVQIDSKLNGLKFMIINISNELMDLFKLVKLDNVFELRKKADQSYDRLKEAS